ncbi:MAG: isopenicillin-N N-acyltransferase like protein, partial [Gaiellales bacterium]|nr:isopenicillin-N N-acyltransferase like protein [Gaiellales bacterium]
MVVSPTAVAYLTTGDRALRLRRLDNIDVLCVDLDRMVPFYRDVIGLPFVLPYERSQGWAGFQAGDVSIFLIEIGGEPP